MITRLINDVAGKEQRNISVKELKKIAEFFNCSLDVLANPNMTRNNSAKLSEAFGYASMADKALFWISFKFYFSQKIINS